MSQELLYTSAPRGLKPGSRGFCTVLSTQGMAAPLATALEGLSGYRPIYPAGDDHANRNPVVYSHLKLQAAGRTSNVLSRIADFGLDYSQRANKLAHHVVLDKTELLPGGPASLLSMRDFMREEWAGDPKVVALKPVKREGRLAGGPCRAWEELTGDAGWAGVLAESFLRDPERLVFLLFAPGQDILPLFIEALSLLPAERRWDVTFSTYFTGLTPGTTCVWRALVHDSKEAHESLRFVNALRLDLTSGSLGLATGDALVEAARSGVRPHDAKPRTAPPIGPVEEEFVELEAAQVEFASDEQQAADIRFASIPQRPPQLAPGRNSLPTTAAPQPRSGRRLADVIEAESRRPRSRRWLWLTLTTASTLIAAFAVIYFVPKARTQISNFFLKPGQPGKALTGRDVPAAASVDAKDQHGGMNKKTEEDATASKRAEEVAAMNKNSEEDAVRNKADEVAAANKKADEDAAKKEADEVAVMNKKAKEVADKNKAEDEKQKAVLQQVSTQPTQTVKDLPQKGKYVVLHNFVVTQAVPNEQLPGMILLKPRWLPFIAGKASPTQEKARHAGQAILYPTATEKITVALFTTQRPSQLDLLHEYRLEILDGENAKWLGWYCIQINPPDGANQPARVVSFTKFPLDSIATRNRHLSKKPVRWLLPKSAAVDSKWPPQLIIPRLVVSISTEMYDFTQKQSQESEFVNQPVWSLECEEFESITYKMFNVQPSKPKLYIKITIDSESPGAISIKMAGMESFLKSISERLHTEQITLNNQIESASKLAGMKEAELAGLLSLLDKIKFESLTSPDVVKTAIEKVRGTIDKLQKDEKPNLEKIVGELRSHYDKIVQYHQVSNSLDNIRIVAARIYYELEDTEKTVDVVNFDDSAKSDPQKKGDGK